MTQNQIPARFVAWLRRKRTAIATVWYVVTILLLALAGKTLYTVRSVKAMTCCWSSFDCLGSGGGQCNHTYGCQQNGMPYMCS